MGLSATNPAPEISHYDTDCEKKKKKKIKNGKQNLLIFHYNNEI